MKEYEITVKHTVTSQEIDDLLVTAFEGGITYWADAVRIKQQPNEDFAYMSDVLTRGGTVEVHDNEEDKDEGWHELTLDKLLEVLGNNDFNFDDYDANDADMIVQKALFGELIYG